MSPAGRFVRPLGEEVDDVPFMHHHGGADRRRGRLDRRPHRGCRAQAQAQARGRGGRRQHQPRIAGRDRRVESPRPRSKQMNMDGIAVVKNHRVVSHEEWITARTAFLAKEKELTRLRDELSEQRRAMPWERVTKDYLFATAAGQQTLDQLFEGRSQLVVYHAMFHPNKATARTPWTQDAACSMCSFWMDNFNGITSHL